MKTNAFYPKHHLSITDHSPNLEALPFGCSYLAVMHKHAAVRWDLERPRTAREDVLRVRQLQIEKGSAQPGPGRRRERGLWRGERAAQDREDALSLGPPSQPPRLPCLPWKTDAVVEDSPALGSVPHALSHKAAVMYPLETPRTFQPSP